MNTPQFAHKLAAIFYADVEGFSRLIEDDEVGTYRRLRRYLNLIESYIEAHHGRIVHYAGDAVLADFATVTDAAMAAVNIQIDLARKNSGLPENRKVQFRIGLNVGEVLVDQTEIYGDGVNIAARLQATAEAGGICISDAMRQAIGTKLNLKYKLQGERHLKNISRPITSYFICFGPDQEFPNPVRIQDKPAVNETRLASRPTVVVLPFVNRSGDSAQDYFCEGFSEDLITELSRFRSISVIGRASAFAYRNTSDLDKIGEELDAQYVLDGSIRHLAGRVRITARLVESETAKEIWVERYDMEAEKLFEIQDDLIGRIVGMLEYRLAHRRLAISKRVPPNSLKTYDLWLRGNKLMENWTAESDNRAIPLFEKAIALDPNFARAYTSLAGIYQSRNLLAPGNPREEEDRSLAFHYAKRAVQLDPMDARNHTNLGWGYMLARDFANGERHFDLAGDLNPNDADISIARGLAVAYLGDAGAGVKLAKRALQLNPFYPDFYLGNLASIYFLAGLYDETVSTIALTPTVWPEIAAWRTAACAHLHLMDEAKHHARQFVQDVQTKWSGETKPSPLDCVNWFFQINAIRRRDDIERLVEGLTGAGLPRPALPLAVRLGLESNIDDIERP